MKNEPEARVLGMTLLSFYRACTNLDYIIGTEMKAKLESVKPEGWYPFDWLCELESSILGAYRNPDPALRRIGEEMMYLWRESVELESGVEYLELQRECRGMHQTVQGPEAVIGRFELIEHDPQQCRAVLKSTTPFQKALEEGIISGGMKAFGDVTNLEIEYDEPFFRVKYC